MSGLVTAGVLLCGLPHAMAESVPQNNETYYSVNVPSEISLSSDQDETTFTVSGNTYQKRWLDIDITSENNFNLKNGQTSIPYKLDKTKFEYEPQYVDKDSDSFSESIKVSKNEADVKYSGNYQDQLQFTMNPVETRTIQLDCNGGTVNGKDKVAYTVKNGSSYGQLPTPVKNGYSFIAWKDEEGNTIYSGSIVKSNTEKLTCVWKKVFNFYVNGTLDGTSTVYTVGFGTCNVSLNGTLQQADSQSGYLGELTVGDVITIDNIKSLSGFEYLGTVSLGSDESNFTIQKDSNGKVVSITYTVSTSNNIRLNYKSLFPYNTLMSNNNLTKITIDEDKPKQKVKSIGTMSGFDSIVDCYADGDTLHIYNVNGGKVKAPVDSYRLFQSCTATSMDLKGLDVSNVENASYMFQNCTKLENVDVSNWDTSHMQNLEGLFYYCTSLKQVDLNNWNISNVTILQKTFFRCQHLVELKIDKWDVSNVKNFASIFGYCSDVKVLNLKEWKTSSAETFYAMFDGCTHVTTLDVSNFDTSKVYSLAWMYSGTWNLNNIIGMENWNVNNVSSADHMFSATHVSTLELPDFTQSRIRDITNMFTDNYYLESLDLTKLPMNKITNLTNAFLDCRKLKTIYVQDDYIPKSVIAQGTFNGCTSLVGGSGTKYDPTFIDSTGARIDGGPSNPGYFTAISQKPIETGSVINIEGSDYIIMSQKDTNKFLVTSKKNVRNMGYQHDLRDDGLNKNTYENSSVDKYLENEWYASLSERMKSAIEISIIKQVSYSAFDKNTKQENGPNEQVYNTIKRHVYLPSVEELNMLIDLDNPAKVKDYLDGNSILIRDSYQPRTDYMMVLYTNTGALNQGATHNEDDYYVRPAFIIDLSKVDYTVTGTVNYK